ncbi:uncharacterized protein DFL_009305 [Arthrobotrys flagrans]|uniref:Enoyl reductase (ER) domain-containing protein n=1 Tax=Arthrobotrys flagrans TaxID=97331 RepID=A0A436ZRA5_ARTFL|nr:hypothetical protein DFL_009305 [Arthrobotrys flagrans]
MLMSLTHIVHTSGHEIVVEIAAIPETEYHWEIGDRVGGGWHGGHCHFCTQSKRGQFLICQNEAINGVTMWGGLAQYVLLRREAVVSVPKDVDTASYAPILCAGVTVFNGLRNMNIRHGSIVAIAGVGGLGHLAIQYAANMGYRVVAIGRNLAKKEESLKLGAKAYIYGTPEENSEELKKLGGTDCIVVTANSPDLTSKLQHGLTKGELFVGSAPFDSAELIAQQHAVRGWPAGSSIDSEEAIDFAKEFGVKCIIQKFPLEQIQEAYDIVNSGKVRYRSVIVM